MPWGAGTAELYVPIDVSASFLGQTAARLRRQYPRLAVEPAIADISKSSTCRGRLPRPALYSFLGSTIGNFYPPAAIRLLWVRAAMAAGDRFLMGVDLRKDVGRIEAAYNDARGVTAEFNRNMLLVLNYELGADFDPLAFDHRAFYETEAHRIEMHLVARETQLVTVPGIGVVRFAAGSRCGPRSAASTTARAWRSSSRPRTWSWRSGGPTRHRCSDWWSECGREHRAGPPSRPISRRGRSRPRLAPRSPHDGWVRRWSSSRWTPPPAGDVRWSRMRRPAQRRERCRSSGGTPLARAGARSPTAKGTPSFQLPGGTLTFEPGGQLEFSSPPCRLSALLALLRSVVLPLRGGSERGDRASPRVSTVQLGRSRAAAPPHGPLYPDGGVPRAHRAGGREDDAPDCGLSGQPGSRRRAVPPVERC